MTTVDLKTDSHIHTHLCNHASGELEDYVQAAIDKKLTSLVFLEHLEAGISYFERTWLTHADFKYYFEEGYRLQEKYKNRITIKLGIEVGFNPLAIESLRKTLSLYPWEYAGLSYHFYATGTQHLNMVSRRQENIAALADIGADRVITDYLDGLIRGIQLFDCNTLCHIDAVMRHNPGIQFKPSHWHQIDLILALVKTKKMSLEVNTSGYAIRDEPYPCRRILEKAVQLGIPLVAGSDAHQPDQVGRYFDRLPGFISLLGKPVDPDSPDHVKPAT